MRHALTLATHLCNALPLPLPLCAVLCYVAYTQQHHLATIAKALNLTW